MPLESKMRHRKEDILFGNESRDAFEQEKFRQNMESPSSLKISFMCGENIWHKDLKRIDNRLEVSRSHCIEEVYVD